MTVVRTEGDPIEYEDTVFYALSEDGESVIIERIKMTEVPITEVHPRCTFVHEGKRCENEDGHDAVHGDSDGDWPHTDDPDE